VSVFAVQFVVGLPVAIYRIFVVEQEFGFNRMTFGLFLSGSRQAARGLARARRAPAMAILWLMEKMGAFWWVYAWVLLVAFLVVFMMIYPALILPLFNKFTPVTDGRARHAGGGAAREVRLQVPGAVRHGRLQALEPRQRVLRRLRRRQAHRAVRHADPAAQHLEVEAVLAHELGHYKLHHIAKGIALSAALSLAGFWILGQVFDQPWFFRGLGVATPSMAAALALFLLGDPEFTFFLDPLMSRYSRKREFEADSYAVRYAQPLGLEQALVKLYKDNASTLTPDPGALGVLRFPSSGRRRIARIEDRVNDVCGMLSVDHVFVCCSHGRAGGSSAP
jgi:STE24 endopeptidase